MSRQVISTPNAPHAVGAYSQGIVANGLVFTSGQIHLKPDGTMVEGDIQTMTRQCMENIKAILETAGASLNDLVKVTIFARDMKNFQAINEVYKSYFTQLPPARSFVEVSNLPRNAQVEIEGIALLTKR
jgi:2-iminobutanoate/2-iminopropanoate deaminase